MKQLPLFSFAVLVLATAPALFSTPTNVALERPVVASSLNNANTPAWAAVDGNSAANARRWVSGVGLPQWIEVDLDGFHSLSQFKFWTSGGSSYEWPMTSFQLQHWDGLAWQVIHSETAYANSGIVDITFPAQLASDRVRMVFFAGQDQVVRLTELEIYGVPHALQVAAHSPARGSAIYDRSLPVYVDFSADIAAVDTSGIQVIRLSDSSDIGAGAVSVSGARLSLSPNLDYGTAYRVVIPAGAVRLSSDPAALNPPVFHEFTVLPADPQVSEHSQSLGQNDAFTVTFDRPITLLDADQIRVIDLAAETEVPLTSIQINGETLELSHAGLNFRQNYLIELRAGAIAGALNSEPNARIARVAHSDTYELLFTTFATGLEGFLTAHGLGFLDDISNPVRRWQWLQGDSPSVAHAGPGGDFTWFGTNRRYENDFGATPALFMEEDEEYTLSLDWRLANARLRVDLRTEPVRNEELPAAFETAHQSVGATGSLNVTLSPETTGDHHFVFYGPVDWHAFPTVQIDNVSVVRTVRPAIALDSPEVGAEFIEGEPLVISGDAFGISADLDRVQVFLDERLIGTFHDNRFEMTVTDYDPGHQDIRIVARDARGVESELVRPITIFFPDGTIAPYQQYSFRTGLEGVTTNGTWQSPGYIRYNPGSGSVYLNTPRIFLQAGETYIFEFDGHQGNHSPHTLFLSLENQPGFPANPTVLATFNVNTESWQKYTAVVHVEFSGAYHFTLSNDGNQPWNQVWIDNVRVIGNFNSAPTVNFTTPPNNTTTLAGAPITLSADASDIDGEVTRVEFWNGSLLIGSVTEPPYTWNWQSAPVGTLNVTAIAYDNAGGISDPATRTIHALENKVSISTNIGSPTETDAFRALAYQADGTLVIGGQIDPALFPSVTPLVLAPATSGDRGVILRMSEDGRTALSATVVVAEIYDLELDGAGNIYIAAGADGILKLDPTASTVLWHHTPADMDIPNHFALRIDAAANGMAAALMSTNSLFGRQNNGVAWVPLVHPDGTLHPQRLGGAGMYTTDIAIDTELERVWITGWKNFVTWEGVTNFPVDVPIFRVRSFAEGSFNEIVLNGYDWESNRFIDGTDELNPNWLNRWDNNMADTRTQRVTIAPNGDVYLGVEYDGGNTPLRYSPFDLTVSTPFVGGDFHHSNENTNTEPKAAIVRLDRVTGEFIAGQFNVPRLSNGAGNTIRLTSGEILVDSAGRVHIIGGAAAGSPHTFDPLPGLHSGGGVHWVLSPDLSTRELVTRWSTSGRLLGGAVSPSGRIAVGGYIEGGVMYRRRALMNEFQGETDALLVVGDFGEYYSFQPGNHPRLFFTADDIPALRYRATQAPFDDMVERLRYSRTVGWSGRAFDENHSYDRSNRAKINAFLYVLTGDEDYALAARADTEWVIAGNGFAWADPTLMGLRSYWMATHIAMVYDWCASSPQWDDAFLFQVSTALVDMARMIINSGGTEQNTNTSSNWQGARGAAGGLALLATDSRFDPSLIDSAFNRVRNYINAGAGSHPESRGWLVEGLGYTYFPFGLYVGPFAEAMARMDGRDLRDSTPISAVYQSILAAPTPAVNVYDWGGIKPDWGNDNMHISGEGVYGQAFFFIDPNLLPAARWIYDGLQGVYAPDGVARWDNQRGGTIWSFLHYPADVLPQPPMELYDWQRRNIDQHGIGIFAFRNTHEDQNDILAHFKARLFTDGGHDGPDGLGFRIIGNDTAWVVGGGRDNPGKTVSQPTLYKVEPGAQLASLTNLDTGTLVGEPLVKVNGGGHVIGQMTSSNMGVASHKRWFVADYDTAATGAQGAFIVADSSTDGVFWQLPTSPFNTITTAGNTFTITAPNGDTMQGTVLHPAGANLAHGVRPRGSAFALLNGGPLTTEDPVLNPQVSENKFVTVEGTGGDFLVVLTIQPAGQSHPAVSRTSGTVADAIVQIGSRSYGITADNILYDGAPYSHASAHIVFDAGDGVISSGDSSQTIAYGAGAVEPEITPPAGQVFLGWDRVFDAVTRSMTVTALYAPIEGTPTAPSFLRGSASTSGAITLLWNDNSIGETGFTVQESTDGGSTWSTVASLPADTTSVVLSGRAWQSTFHYRVRAEGTDAPSAWSATASVSTPAENRPPFFFSTPPAMANEGQLFFYYIQAEDPDDDSMSLTLVEAPAWLTLYDSGGGAGVLTGVPVADAESVDVVIAVSDGVNPAVEQSFSLALNAAPEITLVWPLSTPVYLEPDHGIHAEVSVVDDDEPVSVSWAIVQGPLGTAISAPTALATDLYFERAGTYTVRVTATDALGATSSMDFNVLVDRAPAFEVAEVLAFDRDNNYVDGVSRSFRNSAPSSENLDINGNGTTDTRRWHAFSTETPLNPSQSEGIHGGRFYGGYLVQRFGGTAVNWQTSPGITADGDIGIRFNSTYNATVHWALYWDRKDFKDVAPGAQVVFGPQSELQINIRENNQDYLDVGQIRWLVRANDTFYVSQTVIANTSAGRRLTPLQLANEMWAEYTPVAPIDLNFDQAAATFDTTTQQLGAIQGVGFMVDADDSSFARRFRLLVRGFTLNAEITEAYYASPVISIAPVDTVEASHPATLGATVLFDDDATGTALQWSVVSGPGSVTFDDASAASTTATASLPGDYTLRLTATDDAGNSFREVSWMVLPSAVAAPYITAPPISQTVNEGDPVQFSVTATGEGHLSYQWFKDGYEIPDATGATLAINAVTLADAGDYHVVVSNAGGATPSAVATLTVEEVSLSPVESWRADRFGHLAGGVDHPDAALEADPDGDGIPNILEFALGGDPLIPNTAALPAMSMVSHDNTPHLRLSVPRNPEATDLIFTVEVSADLITWSHTEGTDIVTTEDTPTILIVEDAVPMTPGSPRFIRLRVELTP
jgi:hypothetical protein